MMKYVPGMKGTLVSQRPSKVKHYRSHLFHHVDTDMAAAQVRLKHSKEVVCLAMNDSLLAVGSQSHITLVDPRKKTPVQDIESLDDAHGAAAPLPSKSPSSLCIPLDLAKSLCQAPLQKKPCIQVLAPWAVLVLLLTCASCNVLLCPIWRARGCLHYVSIMKHLGLVCGARFDVHGQSGTW